MMTEIQKLILFLSVIGSGITDGEELGFEENLIGIPLSRSLRVNEPPQQCADFWGVRCADCSRLQVCRGNEQAGLHNCGDINPNTPYCIGRSCSSQPSEECRGELPTSSFICTESGQFPNTKNCSRYFLCPEAGANPIEIECKAPFIYDSRRGQCKRQNTPLDCQKIDCSRSPDQFVVFNGDKSILAYCERGAEFPILTRCPDYENQEYDPNTLKCRFVCRSEGRFPDRLDCKRYNECLKVGSLYVHTHGNCDPLIYNRLTGQCVRGSCSPEIITTTALPPSSPSTSNNNPSPTSTSTALPSSSSSYPIF